MEKYTISWIRRINIVKISVLPKVIYRFNAIPNKLPMVFFRELEQIISQFVWKYKKTLNSQSNLEKTEWNWRNQPAWLQALLQSYSHQDSMVLVQRQKYRSMEQNRKPRDKSTHLWTPYLWQGGKNIQWIKYNLFNKWCWENLSVQFSSVQLLSRVQLFATHESQHARPPCPSPTPGVHSDSTFIESVMPSSHLILCHPLFLLPPIPPSIRVFSNESTLRMRWPK